DEPAPRGREPRPDGGERTRAEWPVRPRRTARVVGLVPLLSPRRPEPVPAPSERRTAAADRESAHGPAPRPRPHLRPGARGAGRGRRDVARAGQSGGIELRPQREPRGRTDRGRRGAGAGGLTPPEAAPRTDPEQLARD